jgi:hypothetical protein
MNIDDLTIGDAKALAAMLGHSSASGSDPYAQYVGKSVIVRSRNEGINFGTVVSANAECVILKDARRIWYHKPADSKQSWYEGVANTGLSGDSKISAPVGQKLIAEDYSLTLCTQDAADNITEAPIHAQS